MPEQNAPKPGQNTPMREPRKWATLLYFALGLLVGGVAGLIAGVLLFEDRPTWITAATVVGALLFGALGIAFKERLLEFFPWY